MQITVDFNQMAIEALQRQLDRIYDDEYRRKKAIEDQKKIKELRQKIRDLGQEPCA